MNELFWVSPIIIKNIYLRGATKGSTNLYLNFMWHDLDHNDLDQTVASTTPRTCSSPRNFVRRREPYTVGFWGDRIPDSNDWHSVSSWMRMYPEELWLPETVDHSLWSDCNSRREIGQEDVEITAKVFLSTFHGFTYFVHVSVRLLSYLSWSAKDEKDRDKLVYWVCWTWITGALWSFV